MQVIHQNKDKESYSRRTDSVDAVIYIRRISRYLKEEYVGRFRSSIVRIWNSGRIFRKEFGRENKEGVKVAKLKELEQKGKIMEKFVQEFKKVIRESECKKRPLVEEFK